MDLHGLWSVNLWTLIRGYVLIRRHALDGFAPKSYLYGCNSLFPSRESVVSSRRDDTLVLYRAVVDE